MKRELTTIGEGVMRLTPAPGLNLANATCFEADFVGAEINVAANLARLGRSVGWVSSLPDTVVGARFVSAVRAHGVDTSRVVWTKGSRVPLQYSERTDLNGGQRSEGSVFYDRADSAFGRLTPTQVDWDYLMSTRWLHVTGGTMVTSRSGRELIEYAVKAARAAGVYVSLDVDLDAALWAAEEARSALMPVLDGVDLLLCASRGARALFGLDGPDEEVLEGLAALTAADKIVLSTDSGHLRALAGPTRFSWNGNPAVAMDGRGARDALAAGVLHGLLDSDFARGLACGVALASLALSRRGATVSMTAEELGRLVEDSGYWMAQHPEEGESHCRDVTAESEP